MSIAPLDNPDYWNSRYRQGDAPWNRGSHSPALEEALLRLSRPGRALIPGCGCGHDVRLLATRGWEAVGIDFAPEALAQARRHGEPANLAYEEADFLTLPDWLRGAFDLVWEHTCFCAIPPERRHDYVRSAHGALRPGGKLLGVFFLRTGPLDPPPYCFTLEELDFFFGSHFLLEAEWLPGQCYPGREGEEILRLFSRKD
ncbi:methyltransferase domain-containing protein [Methylacidimicrobium sp. B4]|uniref:methyltransferase domain-containing protein n=1 Tax=Methylacidimicrobium sp. B4 TaxID=2796139 RepID=UPI001A8D7F12|nr:methyltransferase domain-containing protein [Methylacidimicrobium sp. B4]QSR84108.1 methyltransferase domain-containing protein [Methylacidimicrobium sp. B4]